MDECRKSIPGGTLPSRRYCTSAFLLCRHFPTGEHPLLDNLTAVSVGQGSTAMTCKIMNIIRNRLQAVPDMIPQ